MNWPPNKAHGYFAKMECEPFSNKLPWKMPQDLLLPTPYTMLQAVIFGYKRLYFGRSWWEDVVPNVFHDQRAVSAGLILSMVISGLRTTTWNSKFKCRHYDVIKWKHFPCYWPFVRGIHWSPVDSPHKGQGRGTLMFSLICAWKNGWANNLEAGDLRRHRVHYDITPHWT